MTMLPFSKFHPASLLDLHEWSTLSRNEIGPFLQRFGIQPLGRKFPMLRIYEGVLGLSPFDEACENMLGHGLIRTTKVAGMVGLAPETLLEKVRDRNSEYPPLYVFGPRRHLMLKAQIEQMCNSMRNEWQSIEPLQDHALPAARLARHLEVSQSRIDALLVNKANLPARIITQGRVKYIVSDVERRLTPSGSDKTPSASGNVTHRPAGGAPIGLFSATAAHAAAQAQTLRSCTGSGADARRGDCLHRASAEAKLSKT
jgi:hypothetical protein